MRRTCVLSATLLVVALAATPAFATNRSHGPHLRVTVSPTAAVAGSTDNAFTFKLKAASAARGQLRIVVPAGWSAPQASSPTLPGYVTIRNATCASVGPVPASITGSGPWTMIIDFTCGWHRKFAISYGGSVASSKVTAPTTATSYEFTTDASIPTGSAFRPIVRQPVVTVTGAPVVPDPATHLVVTGLADPSSAAAAQSITVTAKDAFDNTAADYTGTVHFTSTDGVATLPGDYTFTADDAGSHTFASGVTLGTLGSQTITATDTETASIAGSQTVTVQPGPPTRLVVTGLADPSAPGAVQDLTVTATDGAGNTATAYTGTIDLTSSDGLATLPGVYTFTAGDGGTHTFAAGVVLRTGGSQDVTATDAASAGVKGTQTVTVADTLYVATGGSDANVGSQTAPLQTIDAAVALTASLSGVLTVQVAEGSYNEGVDGVAVVDGITISGGYAPDWTQTGGATTIVGLVGSVLADDDTGVSLDHLALAPAAAGNPGSSVYGLRAINGSSVAIANVTIATPNATDGLAGAPGRSGFGGQPGQPGQAANDDCNEPAGLGGGGGTLFVSGGKGGDTDCGGRAPGEPGSGGGGGRQGSPGGCCSGFVGGAGGPGFPGSPGPSGLGGPANPSLADVTWLGHDGNDGSAGGPGSGGGGGGAGGTFDCGFFCFAHPGGGGGGGGGGGQGGQGGQGGRAGGGSFGVYLSASTLTVSNTAITVGRGGNGGGGGPRGNGGPGAPGGPGGFPSTVSAGFGGRGGFGGNGGPGGPGGGGAGGPSVGIFRANGSTAVIGADVTFALGGGGSGGFSAGGGGSPGQSGFAVVVF